MDNLFCILKASPAAAYIHIDATWMTGASKAATRPTTNAPTPAPSPNRYRLLPALLPQWHRMTSQSRVVLAPMPQAPTPSHPRWTACYTVGHRSLSTVYHVLCFELFRFRIR